MAESALAEEFAMSRRNTRVVINVVIAVLFAGGVAYLARDSVIGEPAGPSMSPPPGLGVSGQDGTINTEANGIDLGQPLAQSFEIEIAGRKFMLPAGATAVQIIEGAPVIDINTGKAAGGPVEHQRYWLISLGASNVKVDDSTGEVFDAQVLPQHESALAAFGLGTAQSGQR